MHLRRAASTKAAHTVAVVAGWQRGSSSGGSGSGGGGKQHGSSCGSAAQLRWRQMRRRVAWERGRAARGASVDLH